MNKMSLHYGMNESQPLISSNLKGVINNKELCNSEQKIFKLNNEGEDH